MNKVTIEVGEALFAFHSFSEWVNKAQSWFAGHRKYICIDEAGRILQTGKEFKRARDDNNFPVTVYSIELPSEE